MKPAEIEKYRVSNMSSYRGGGDSVANQFLITINTDKGTKRIFQSYKTIIAVRDEGGNVTLDKHYWDYSATTSRYRNQFLREKTAETRQKIDSGVYKLADLN